MWRRLFSEKLEEKQIAKDDVQGIGLGVPGPVGADGTVHKCVNLGWGVINVEQILSEKTGLLVKAGNDANVAALGEMWQGGGKGCSNVVAVTLGTGVGGGVVINGHVIAGVHGLGGELGHIHVRDEEKEFLVTAAEEAVLSRLQAQRELQEKPDGIWPQAHSRRLSGNSATE